MELFGIRLVGLNAETGHKLLLSLGLAIAVAAIGLAVKAGLGRNVPVGRDATRRADRVRFWSRQAINLLLALAAALGLVSIWFDNPANLSAALGLFTAGLAFALQKVVTSLAGYFVILRGNNFTVGDRITMGGVRGDVIALGFFQTTIMEMGEPPPVQSAAPAVWVQSRQFTGRIVTVANSRIFDEPIYNYTRDFPFIWEEMHVGIAYRDDRAQAEGILLEAARAHAVRADEVEPALLARIAERFGIGAHDFEPKVYWRLTDNWLEMAVRFITHDHGSRRVKDAMSRQVLAGLDAAGIGIASATMEITALPPLRVERAVR